MRTNRRDVMRDAQGEQQLIEEYVGNLIGRTESLLDMVIDLEALVEEKDVEIETLQDTVVDLESTIEELKERLEDAKSWSE